MWDFWDQNSTWNSRESSIHYSMTQTASSQEENHSPGINCHWIPRDWNWDMKKGRIFIFIFKFILIFITHDLHTTKKIQYPFANIIPPKKLGSFWPTTTPKRLFVHRPIPIAMLPMSVVRQDEFQSQWSSRSGFPAVRFVRFPRIASCHRSGFVIRHYYPDECYVLKKEPVKIPQLLRIPVQNPSLYTSFWDVHTYNLRSWILGYTISIRCSLQE